MGPSGYNKGSVSSFKVYNRPLSSSEILQNYQAQFPRFLGKNIVMNGLIHYLDAGYNGSYPTSGTSWYNISGVSGGTGTLTNGPVYSGDGGGSIVFDGVDDYVSTLNSTNINSIYSNNQFTLQIWIKYDDSGQYRNIAGVLKNSDFTFFAIGMRVGIFNNLFFDGVFNGSRVTQTIINDISPFRNAWVNVTASYRNGSLKTYFNGVLVLTTSTTGQLDNFTSNSFKIAEQAGYGYFKGNISNFNLYNKQLTDIEILQNYQAQLPTIVGENFITNGLVLYLDAKYKTSYPGTGTTWNNVSGVSGGTNTLVNGPVYSGTSGGTITFDGTDDYADFNAPNLGTTVTVEMWCKIGSGYSNKMFFGWDRYDVWCNGGNIGFNTAASDLYGISSSSVSSLGLVNNWKHYVFEMRSDVPYTNNKIYINGTSQTLSQQIGTENASVRNFNNGNGRIAFWRNGSGAGTFNMPMECAVFKVYNRSLTQNEINQNFNATKSRFGI
jgi:hypothetical protein